MRDGSGLLSRAVDQPIKMRFGDSAMIRAVQNKLHALAVKFTCRKLSRCEMQQEVTPKKPAKRGRKPHDSTANDFCRLCNIQLVLRYGDFPNKYLSTENLFTVPKDSPKTLALLCSEIGFDFAKSVVFSNRVCKTCGRNIRSTHRFYKIIEGASRKENSLEELQENEEGETERVKRLLPTTISPERSRTKVQKSGSARKALSFKALKVTPEDKENEDPPLADLDVEALQEKKTTQVKVVILYPSGKEELRFKFEDERKSLLINVARKKWATVANQVFKHTELKAELCKPLERAIGAEFRALCKDSAKSVLQAKSPKEVAHLTTQVLLEETNAKCPLWTAAIHGASGVKDNSDAPKHKINGMALSTAMAARTRNQKMSAMAYRVSTILFHSGVKSDDILRLCKMGVCMSPDQVVNFQKKMGDTCTAKLNVWKSEIEKEKKAALLLEEVLEVGQSLDLSDENCENLEYYSKEVTEYCREVVQETAQQGIITREVLQAAVNQLHSTPLPLYKIVGDNIDLTINARIQSSTTPNRSLHWTQQYAVINRVNEPLLDTTTPQKPIQEIDLVDLLPTKAVQDNLVQRWAVLVSRIVCKYLAKFQSLRDVVVHHIPHPYSAVMNTKSESCSLGVEFLNPNVSGDMAQLLLGNQEKYVPVFKLGDGSTKVLSPVPYHGDQLFEERARNTQWTYQDGNNEYERIQGIDTEFADWHGKYNLYMVEFSTFVNDASAREVGTSRASMNRTMKSNAAKGVQNHYNEYKEFHQREIEAHVCASFMEFNGMSNMEDSPRDPMPGSNIPKEQRRKWLLDHCVDFVRAYALDQEVAPLVEQVEELEVAGNSRFPCRVADCDKTYTYHSTRVRHEVKQHAYTHAQFTGGDERDPYGYFYCRLPCGLVFSTKCIRNSHERKEHQSEGAGPMEVDEDTGTEAAKEDSLFNYHRSKLVFGLTLFELDDAIREGDGERLHEAYKFALLIFKAHHKTKYAYVILLHLVKLAGMLSEKDAHDLKWNRFYNKHGLRGGNIPLDLRMEHMNKVVKTMWKGLGANLNEKNAKRVAETIEPVELIMDNIDIDCGITSSAGFRSSGSPGVAVTQITKDLIQIGAFKRQPGRIGHPTFLDFPSNLIKKLDYRDFHSWITDHIKLWGSVYGLRAE